MFKEGERAYAKFSQQTGPQDQEFEKDLERMIDEKMAQGLDDNKIIDSILTGGRQSYNRADINKIEKEKEDELLKEALAQGQTPFSMGDSDLFGSENEASRFEDFQQRAGKMLYEQD